MGWKAEDSIYFKKGEVVEDLNEVFYQEETDKFLRWIHPGQQTDVIACFHWSPKFVLM